VVWWYRKEVARGARTGRCLSFFSDVLFGSSWAGVSVPSLLPTGSLLSTPLCQSLDRVSPSMTGNAGDELLGADLGGVVAFT